MNDENNFQIYNLNEESTNPDLEKTDVLELNIKSEPISHINEDKINDSIANKEDNKINTIHLTNYVTPTYVNDPNANKEVYKEYVIKRDNNTTIFFILCLMMIIVLILFVVCYLYLPTFINKKHYNINDKVTTKPIETYTFQNIRISSSVISSIYEYKVNDTFKIKTTLNGNQIAIYVNDNFISIHDHLLSNIALVHDLIILICDDTDDRTTVLYVVDSKGNVIKKVDSINSSDNKIVNNSVVFNKESIFLKTSKVDGINLYVNNSLYNVCDKNMLNSIHIDSAYVVKNSFNIFYKGDHEFDKPISKNAIELQKYVKDSHVCE